MMYETRVQNVAHSRFVSNGSSFFRGGYERWWSVFTPEAEAWLAGDFDGDGREDVSMVDHTDNDANALGYTSAGPVLTIKDHSLGANYLSTMFGRVGDSDGDGRDDLVLVYGATNDGATAWTYSSIGSGFTRTRTQRLGVDFWDSQVWLPANLDGDGKEGVSLFYRRIRRVGN